MAPVHTQMLTESEADLDRAAALLRDGELVAFPTETVYGLGADARSDNAVARIFEAKGRPRFNPLIVHVRDHAAASAIAEFGGEADRLSAAFWPGPLTLVLPLRSGAGIAPLVTAGLETVAVRVPANPLAQRLLAAFGGPIAAPSANPSGRVSPSRAAHVLQGLEGRIAAVVDGGACEVGLESTIVAIGAEGVRLLRPGGLPVEAVEACVGRPLSQQEGSAARPLAPGQLASHYAPGARLRLEARERRGGEVWIGFGRTATAADFNLSPSGDLVEAAGRLFHLLREADALAGKAGVIAVSPVPERGLGQAINDRLRRAAAPRP